MVELDLLGPEDPVELIEGEILLMSPEGVPHAPVMNAVRLEIDRAFGSGYHTRQSNPMALDGRSEPEPDLAVVKGQPMDCFDANEHPATAALVVEVSSSSRDFDLGRTSRLYARAAIPEYWMVDLVEQRVHVPRDPSSDGYRSIQSFDRSASVRPILAPAESKPVPLSNFLR